MAERRISFLIDIDLSKGSKEAHAVTIEKIAHKLGGVAVDLMEAHNYDIRRAVTTTEIHYVRHILKDVVVATVKRRLRKVG